MSRLGITYTVQTADQAKRLSVASGATVNIYLRNTDGSAGALTSVFSSANTSNNATLTQPLLTDINGNIPGWLNPGDYIIQATVAGTTNSVPYTVPGDELQSHKDQSSGYAGLDSSGLLKISELPPSVVTASSVVVDLCAAPQSGGPAITGFHVPGDDLTADIQAVVNWANTNNLSVKVRCSKQGTYNINGAQQTGAVTGTPTGTYNYSGQIVFPARNSFQTLTLTFEGMAPGPSNGAGMGGMVLNTNATSGWIFDAIPLATNPGYAFTGWYLVFQDISITGPTNPQCGFVNGSALYGLAFRGLCALQPGYTSSSTPTGTKPGIIFPPTQNGGLARQEGELWIGGFATCIQHYEHLLAEFLAVGNCVVGLAPASTQFFGLQHAAHVHRLNVQGAKYAIQPVVNGGGAAGNIPVQLQVDICDLGDQVNGLALTYVVNDPSNIQYGNIGVHITGYYAGTGFYVNGASNVSFFEPVSGASKTPWPNDNFTRITQGSHTDLGVAAGSGGYWPWTNVSGGFVFNAYNGPIKASSTAFCRSFIQYLTGRPSPSRVITVNAILQATPIVYVLAGRVISGAKAGNHLGLLVQNNQISLHKWTAAGATDVGLGAATSVTVSAAAHTLQLVISHTPGGSYTLTGILDPGASQTVVGPYTMTATDIADLLETDALRTQDGVGFFLDTSSTISSFAVSPT